MTAPAPINHQMRPVEWILLLTLSLVWTGSSITLAAQCALLGATICYAVAVVFGRRFRSLGVSPMMMVTGQVMMSSLILLPAWLLIDRP